MTSQPLADLLELRHAATDRATIVVVPERTLLVIDGVGAPTATDFRYATQILRQVELALRQRLRRERPGESRTPVVESAWWIHPELPPNEMAAAFADRSAWHWQQMIEVPSASTEADIDAAIEAVRQGAGRPFALVRAIQFAEGRSAQILHIGGVTTETDSVQKLYQALDDAGLRSRGHLHQIHLAEAARVPAERVRSIIRLPIEPD
ncbi:MAG: hypothetical protein ACRDIL_08600 [Candidatus Limnocylindrales bacterium]